MKELIFTMITMLSPQYGIEPELTQAIIKVESNGNHRAIGLKGEVGLMQIRPEFSKFSKEELFNIETNIKEGLRILSEAKLRCKHKENYTFVVCFNGGVGLGKKIKHPTKFPYYSKVMLAMRE